MSGKWAFIFANAAANAEFSDNIRLHQVNRFPFAVDRSDFFKLDGLVMGWAVFFADNAGAQVSKGEAALLVNKCNSDDKGVLFRLAQLANGSGRTYLAAQGTVELAVTEPGDKFRGKHALIATLHETGLKCILDTDFHALSAADALGEKFSSTCSPWWTKQGRGG